MGSGVDEILSLKETRFGRRRSGQEHGTGVLCQLLGARLFRVRYGNDVLHGRGIKKIKCTPSGASGHSLCISYIASSGEVYGLLHGLS